MCLGWRIWGGVIVVSSVVTAHAHDPDVPIVETPEVSVVADRPVAASSQQFIPDKEYVMQPQGRPAQVLRLIPGMVAVEHSGGAGKADQYFLRGFDADHGTDIAFFADGMPINFRSHAHGQGYADLNFIIPETIEGLDVHKGAYLPEYGDFSTAGAINFKIREVVREGIRAGYRASSTPSATFSCSLRPKTRCGLSLRQRVITPMGLFLTTTATCGQICWERPP